MDAPTAILIALIVYCVCQAAIVAFNAKKEAPQKRIFWTEPHNTNSQKPQIQETKKEQEKPTEPRKPTIYEINEEDMPTL